MNSAVDVIQSLEPGNRQPRIPGEPGIWVFIWGDLIIFSLFFCIYLFYREADVALFNSSQATLDQRFGITNTIVLLTSSWFVATGVHAARLNRPKAPAFLLILGFLCGLVFLVLKVFEYSAKFDAGINIKTNEFYMYYFVFTVVHAIHVIFGMAVLFYLYSYCKNRSGKLAHSDIVNLESGAIFWHLVDLLWIVLFALLYLVK